VRELSPEPHAKPKVDRARIGQAGQARLQLLDTNATLNRQYGTVCTVCISRYILEIAGCSIDLVYL